MLREQQGSLGGQQIEACTAESPPDAVNRPAHYAEGWTGGVEIIQITEHLNFCRGNAVKYITRAGRKDPSKELEDLRKAQWYLAREIARLEKK